MTKKAEREAEKARALEVLREYYKPGAVAATILRHVARSGMSRSVSLIASGAEGPVDLTWAVCRALDLRFDEKHGGAKVGGCGMDAGFSLVYNLGYALFPDGFTCTGIQYGAGRCPSNDHSNGDRDYTPHHHKDGGYSLNHRWI